MRHQRRTFRTLVDLFSRRFFENDLLAPDIDLRPSAIWLMGALLMPSCLWTAKRIVHFGFLSVHGIDAVEAASWFDKSLLMALAMANAGLVTLLCWEALLVDRRDALVLGSLPVSPWLVVLAKGTALIRVFAVVAALNLPSMALLAVGVYGHFSAGLMVRSVLAHLVAATAASLAMAGIVTALLVAATSLLSGRRLRIATVAVQAVVLGALTALLLGLQWTPSLGPAARAGDGEALAWLTAWPPLWFLSLYQVLIGVEQGRTLFEAHAGRAVWLTAAAAAAVPITLALWRRALAAQVAAAPGEPAGRRRPGAGWLTTALVRPGLTSALAQFSFAVLARSPRHRLAVLGATGLALALSLEAVLVLSSRPTDAGRWLTEFGVPLLVLAVLGAVSRWLLTLPAELPATWTLALTAPCDGRSVRAALHRVLVLVVVLPPTLLAAGLSWWQGGPAGAAAHAGLTLALSLLVVERTLARLDFMPFATEFLPDRSNLKARWPVHFVVLVFVIPVAAQIERALVTGALVPWLVAMALGSAGVAAAVVGRLRKRDEVTVEPPAGAGWTPATLNLAQALAASPRALQ